MCKVLVEMGAVIEVKNDNEMTPPEFAARYGDGNAKDVFNCIMWLNQDRTKNNKDERTKMTKEKTLVRETSILRHAIQNRNWAANTFVAEELIKSGRCKISETDKEGNTSLHLAAMSDKEEEHKILDLFLENEKINDEDLIKCLETKNKEERTPFHIACGVGNHESVKQLINKGKQLDVDVGEILNSRDVNKLLPIYTAIDSDNEKLLDVLMSHDIDLQITDNDVNRAARWPNPLACSMKNN